LPAIIGGLAEAGLKITSSDIVEFTPVYDNAAETQGGICYMTLADFAGSLS
jgi:agmatinase